jgi:hypothetical protein
MGYSVVQESKFYPGGNMRKNLVRAITVLVLPQLLAVVTTKAQTRPIHTQCDKTDGRLKRQDVNQFVGSDRGPIGVVLCDGTTYVGVISEMKANNFTVKTDKNQFVQIDYTFVKQIGLQNYFGGVSHKAKIDRQIEHFLLLPFTIVECLLASCGS